MDKVVRLSSVRMHKKDFFLLLLPVLTFPSGKSLICKGSMFLRPLLGQHTVRGVPTNVLRNTCSHDKNEVHALVMPDTP